MAAVSVDSERLKALIVKLKRFSDTAEQELTVIDREVHDIGHTWRDAKFREFETAFKECQGNMRKQSEVIRKMYVPFLEGLVKDLESYQQRRPGR